VTGIDRKNPVKAAKALADLAKSSAEIRKILLDFRPDVCIGTGGYVAGPVIRVARKMGIRTMIQEQNVIPGMANKMAERYADVVFAGFAESVKYFKDRGKVIVSGNPVRGVFAEAAPKKEEYREKYGIPEGAFCVLFFGGSQGAEALNAAAADAITGIKGDYYFILITGRDYYDEYAVRFGDARFPTAPPEGLLLLDYSDSIYELYAAADLIVSRAGALTVTEIAECGRASILIPSPNVANNHQYYNAKSLADAGAAVLLSEDEDVSCRLAVEIERLAKDTETLELMGKAAAGMASSEAVKVIVDEIYGS
jgi:UDP-N-acetylglucosamine--N-acetylmuramyl-(pentapeptide) pyrophosphoryl-undecaprenol N-acetylglucosamine transferase